MTIENDDSAIAVAACLSACVAAYGVYLGLPLIEVVPGGLAPSIFAV
mgnify:CR=1 FL=1